MNIFLNCQVFSGIIFTCFMKNSLDFKKTNTENFLQELLQKFTKLKRMQLFLRFEPSQIILYFVIFLPLFL